MMNKLMPILAKAVVLPGVLAISGLVGYGHELDRSADLPADIVKYEVVDTLDNSVIDNTGDLVEIKAIDVLNQLETISDIDLPNGHLRGGELDLARDQILDVEKNQVLEYLDTVELINR